MGISVATVRTPVFRRNPVYRRRPITHAVSILHAEAGRWVGKFPRGLSDRADLLQEGHVTFLRAQQLYDSGRSFAAFDTYFTTSLRNRYKTLLARAWGWQRGDDEQLRVRHTLHRVGSARPQETVEAELDESAAVDVRLAMQACSPEEREYLQLLHNEEGCVSRAAKSAGVKVVVVNRYRRLLKRRMDA